MKSFSKIRIANKQISSVSPAFIIAEVGINHEGSYKKCLQLIDKAKLSGADAVKIQLANAELNYGTKIKSYKLYKKTKLSINEIKNIYKYAKRKKIILFATMDNYYLKNIKISQPLYKISSSQLNDLNIIKKVCNKRKPVLISTGMTETKEIKKLYDYFKNEKYKVIFLHCVSKYPLKTNECNLSVLNFLQNNTTELVGYSDHTNGTLACEIAVARGAKIIEKHFTDNSKKLGYDHNISLDYKNFKVMVNNIRNIEKILGSVSKNNQLKKEKIITNQKKIIHFK